MAGTQEPLVIVGQGESAFFRVSALCLALMDLLRVKVKAFLGSYQSLSAASSL